MINVNRRADADRGDPRLLAAFDRNADEHVQRQRARDAAAIAAARQTPPISSWAEVAAWVDDDVWERVLDDMPVSRPSLERIRPSRYPRTTAGQPRAA